MVLKTLTVTSASHFTLYSAQPDSHLIGLTFMFLFYKINKSNHLQNFSPDPSFGTVFDYEIDKTKENGMRSYLINKNLCLCYWLRKRIGKKQAYWITNHVQKAILIFGRDGMKAQGL